VVYFIEFVNGFPHANSKVTLTSFGVCKWIYSDITCKSNTNNLFTKLEGVN